VDYFEVISKSGRTGIERNPTSLWSTLKMLQAWVQEQMS